jgi:hypothetical protein
VTINTKVELARLGTALWRFLACRKTPIFGLGGEAFANVREP